jgi:hypothetical protein
LLIKLWESTPNLPVNVTLVAKWDTSQQTVFIARTERLTTRQTTSSWTTNAPYEKSEVTQRISVGSKMASEEALTRRGQRRRIHGKGKLS